MRKPLIMFVSLCLILTFTSLSFLNTNLALSQPIISQATTETVSEFSCYRSLTEIYARIADLTTQYPHLAQSVDIGNSWQKQTIGSTNGYDLLILKLTNQNINETKPALFVVSALHSRDLAPVELNLRFAEMLLGGYGDDPDITWLLDKTEIDLLIIANPDGRAVVEQQIVSGAAGEFGSNARKKNLNAKPAQTPPIQVRIWSITLLFNGLVSRLAAKMIILAVLHIQSQKRSPFKLICNRFLKIFVVAAQIAPLTRKPKGCSSTYKAMGIACIIHTFIAARLPLKMMNFMPWPIS